MKIAVRRSLYKPLFWGGLPRVPFILMVLGTILGILLFKTFKLILPVAVVYMILAAVLRYDPRILEIVSENFKFKKAYLSD